MAWYYAEDGQQQGPVSDPEFESMVRQGEIRSDTLVWREGMAEWQAYGEMAAEPVATVADPQVTGAHVSPETASAVGGTAHCVECGRLFPTTEMLPYRDVHVCATCKPVFFQRIQEGAALPSSVEYGGFWIRFVAKIVDGVILQVVNTALYVAILPLFAVENEAAAVGLVAVMSLIGIGITIGYSVFFLGRFAATPGKMALGLKVVRSDGTQITYLRAFGRTMAEYLSMLILYIGYIMAAFDAQKRALHDHLADTRVIKDRF